jgi:hypothetical protein
LDLVRWALDERHRSRRQPPLILREVTLRKLLLPLVALAAGTLLDGALFHMIPASVDKLGNHLSIYVWILLGFAIFLGLERVKKVGDRICFVR